MTLTTNLGVNSASTKDWLEVTKNESISGLAPNNVRTEIAVSSGTEIFTQADFEGALKKASARVENRNLRTKRR
jgi:hypothetical protein